MTGLVNWYGTSLLVSDVGTTPGNVVFVSSPLVLRNRLAHHVAISYVSIYLCYARDLLQLLPCNVFTCAFHNNSHLACVSKCPFEEQQRIHLGTVFHQDVQQMSDRYIFSGII